MGSKCRSHGITKGGEGNPKVMASTSPASNATALVLESKLPSDRLQFTWTIAEFAQVNDSEEMIKATETRLEMGRSIGCSVTIKTFLQLKKAENNATEENRIGVFFRALSGKDEDGEAPEKVMVTAQIKIGDYTETRFSPHDIKKMSWGWPRLFPQNVDLSRLPLDAHGSLPIDVTLTLYNVDGRGLTLNNLMPKYKSKFHQKLTENLDKMYKQPDQFAPGAPTMISVVSNDGKEVPSNSMMLAARSPVFQGMFQTPMKETKEGVVNLMDIGGDALMVFLHFMHTGVLLESWKEPEVLEDLTCAAHKYLMQDLVDFLDEAIGLACTPENCMSMIRVAQRLEMKKAEAALLKMRQDQWKLAEKTEEMAKLCEE